MKNVLRFTTILIVAITLSALMAHLLEIPNKLPLSKNDYLTVQGIYSGWSLLGIFEIGAIVLTAVWAFIERKRKHVLTYLILAFSTFVLSLVVFFLYTLPANQATLNWSELPDNWELQRKNWEYSHAVRAILNLFGFSCLIISLLIHNSQRSTIRT